MNELIDVLETLRGAREELKNIPRTALIEDVLYYLNQAIFVLKTELENENND